MGNEVLEMAPRCAVYYGNTGVSRRFHRVSAIDAHDDLYQIDGSLRC